MTSSCAIASMACTCGQVMVDGFYYASRMVAELVTVLGPDRAMMLP